MSSNRMMSHGGPSVGGGPNVGGGHRGGPNVGGGFGGMGRGGHRPPPEPPRRGFGHREPPPPRRRPYRGSCLGCAVWVLGAALLLGLLVVLLFA